MSEGRKRSRKSKLEVRNDDCDYVIVSENNDEKTTATSNLEVGRERLHFVHAMQSTSCSCKEFCSFHSGILCCVISVSRCLERIFILCDFICFNSRG